MAGWRFSPGCKCCGPGGCDGTTYLTIRLLNLADGSGIAGATVTLTLVPNGAAYDSGTTDANGEWKYPVFVAGQYYWRIDYNGCSALANDSVPCAGLTSEWYYCKGSITIHVRDESTGAPIAGAGAGIVLDSSPFGTTSGSTDANGDLVLTTCYIGQLGPNCDPGKFCVPDAGFAWAVADGYLHAGWAGAPGPTYPGTLGGTALTEWTCGQDLDLTVTLKPKVDPGGLAPVAVDQHGAATCPPAVLTDPNNHAPDLASTTYKDWGYVPPTIHLTWQSNGATLPDKRQFWSYDGVAVAVTWDGVFPWDNNGQTFFRSACLGQSSGAICPSAPITGLNSFECSLILGAAGGVTNHQATYTNYFEADCSSDLAVNDFCPTQAGGVWSYPPGGETYTGDGCTNGPLLLTFPEGFYPATCTVTE